MFFRYPIALILAVLSSQSSAFQCYITLTKDSCWTDYEVTVSVINSLNEQTLTTVSVPKGKQWERQAFECQPGMSLMYSASFLPVFWENDVGRSYSALRYLFLPTQVKPGESAWDIPVCFAADFSGVPLPPNVSGNCKCDSSGIPPVSPEVIKSS